MIVSYFCTLWFRGSRIWVQIIQGNFMTSSSTLPPWPCFSPASNSYLVLVIYLWASWYFWWDTGHVWQSIHFWQLSNILPQWVFLFEDHISCIMWKWKANRLEKGEGWTFKASEISIWLHLLLNGQQEIPLDFPAESCRCTLAWDQWVPKEIQHHKCTAVCACFACISMHMYIHGTHKQISAYIWAASVWIKCFQQEKVEKSLTERICRAQSYS